MLKKNSTVLFQGDSVTDVGRDRDDFYGLTSGYPMLINAIFQARYPELNVSFINRGISGNRVKDLRARWQEDCLDLKPDVVSILIGVNDTWRKYDSNDPTSTEDYYNDYKGILTDLKNNGIEIIILEPFILNVMENQSIWREDINPKIQMARKLAQEFNATYIALDGMFATASMIKPNTFWLKDGVHPTMEGHALIAKEWLNAMQYSF